MSDLTQEETIEYYLGKDKFKNLYFKGKSLPGAYDLINDRKNDYDLIIKNREATFFAASGTPEERSFTSRINNLGYRDSIDYSIEDLQKFKKLFICVGCSDVLGPNLEDEYIWPNILQTKIDEFYGHNDFKVLNLGVLSGAPDTVSRILHGFVSCLSNISDACIVWPYTQRREFVSVQKTFIITGMTQINELPFPDYWNFIDWKSDSYNLHKNKIFCESFTKVNNINFHDLIINRYDKKVPFDFSSQLHALGKKSNAAVANYFFKKITNQPSLFEERKCSKA